MANHYSIYYDNALIGTSALEERDPAVEMAQGRFLPADGYGDIEPLCQDLSLALFEASRCEDAHMKAEIEARIEAAWRAWGPTRFRVTDGAGRAIQFRGIAIVDYSRELQDEAAREVHLRIDSPDVWNAFFGASDSKV